VEDIVDIIAKGSPKRAAVTNVGNDGKFELRDMFGEPAVDFIGLSFPADAQSDAVSGLQSIMQDLGTNETRSACEEDEGGHGECLLVSSGEICWGSRGIEFGTDGQGTGQQYVVLSFLSHHQNL